MFGLEDDFLDELRTYKEREQYLEAKILGFRQILSRLYKEQPFNDEGNRCCPSTIYEVIEEYDKHFDVTTRRCGLKPN